MTPDRRADHPALPFWKKPNWMGPAMQATAIVATGAFTWAMTTQSSTKADVLSTSIQRQVLASDSWDLVAAGVEGTMVVQCGDKADIAVTIVRANHAPVTTVLCPTHPNP